MVKKKETNKKGFTLKIDQAIADALGIDQDSDVEMYVKDKMLIIKPKNATLNQAQNAKSKELTKNLMDKYDSVLKKLAKT